MRRSNLKIAKELIKLVKPLAGYMALAIFLGVLGFLSAIFIPALGVIAALDAAGYSVGIGMVFAFVLIIVCAIFRGFLRYGEQLCNHYIAFKLLALIRDQVFRALRRLAPAKMETKNKGNLISVLTSDIELLEVFYAHTISPIAIATLTSIIMLVFFGVIHPLFALIAFCAYITVGVIIPFATSKAGKNNGSSYRDQSGMLSNYLLDSLRGVREVMQYEQGEKRLDGIHSHTKKLSSVQSKLKTTEGISSAVTGAAILLFSFAMLAIGGILFEQQALGADAIILSFAAMISSFGPVVALSSLANNLVLTFASGNRVIDILEESPITTDVSEGVNVTFDGAECKEIDFRYDDEAILDKFNLTIQKGQTLGIIGKSGSGKSTLLRLLMRFWDVTKGNVNISEVDIRSINTSNLRDIESFMTQETQLFDDTIENNIKIGKLDASHEEVISAAKKASFHDFVTTLPKGYESSVGELGDALSGGEKQRIGLARAFLHDAPLLLLDEPTSNLDSLNEGVILKSLKGETNNKTVVIVSHRLSTMSVADEVISMNSERAS